VAYDRILLVKPRGKRGLGFIADTIPIGLEYIAATIEKEVKDVQILDLELEKQPFQFFINRYSPGIVGISMSATEHKEGLRLASIAKINRITTVLGGYHPTAIPGELLSYPQVDIVVRGEGEYTFRDLIRRGTPEDVLGVSYKKDGVVFHNDDRPCIEQLDSLPFPARHLRRVKYRNHMYRDGREYDVITMSRGCYGKCSFCCETYMNHGNVRFRSPENIIDELHEISDYHQGKPLKIFVTDPSFMSTPKIMDRLCDLLLQSGLDISFSVMARVDSIVRNPELVKKMCAAGIRSYELGFESANEDILNDVNKGITLGLQREAVEILLENGANVSGTFVIGLPGQSEADIKNLPVYAKQLGLMNAAFGIATPFAGTEFYDDLEKEGLIFDRDWTNYDEMHSVIKLDTVDPQRLEELQTYCLVRFWTLNTFLIGLSRKLDAGEKISLKQLVDEVASKLRFARDAGLDLRGDNVTDQLRVLIEASVDSDVEESNRNIAIHDSVELSRFLTILGSQRIQLSLSLDDYVASYIIETSSKRVHQVKIISEVANDASMTIKVDLENTLNQFNNFSILRMLNMTSAAMQSDGITEHFNKLRLFTALATELGWPYLKELLKMRLVI